MLQLSDAALDNLLVELQLARVRHLVLSSEQHELHVAELLQCVDQGALLIQEVYVVYLYEGRSVFADWKERDYFESFVRLVKQA